MRQPWLLLTATAVMAAHVLFMVMVYIVCARRTDDHALPCLPSNRLCGLTRVRPGRRIEDFEPAQRGVCREANAATVVVGHHSRQGWSGPVRSGRVREKRESIREGEEGLGGWRG